jgi:hypothetical protein
MKNSFYSVTLSHPKIEGLEIVFTAKQEDQHPADHFDNQYDIDNVITGSEIISNSYWFCAEVVVRVVGTEGLNASDTLGCCSYKTFEEFHNYENRDYFADMVDTATADLIPQLSRAMGDIESILSKCERLYAK